VIIFHLIYFKLESKMMKSQKIWWLVTFTYMVIIFFLSSIPGKDIPLIFPFSDKIIHLVEYMILSLLLKKALSSSSFKYVSILAVLIGVIYGVSDEFHQSFVHGRKCDPGDLIFDTIGCILGQFLIKK